MYSQNYGQDPNYGMQQGYGYPPQQNYLQQGGYPPPQNYYQQAGYQQGVYQQGGYQQGGFQPQFDTSYQLYNQQPQQTIIIKKQKQAVIKNISSFGDKVKCTLCSRDTATIQEHTMGCVAVVWCLVLTPCLLCCVPCLIDSCKDKYFKCANCKTIKTQSKANCC